MNLGSLGNYVFLLQMWFPEDWETQGIFENLQNATAAHNRAWHPECLPFEFVGNDYHWSCRQPFCTAKVDAWLVNQHVS